MGTGSGARSAATPPSGGGGGAGAGEGARPSAAQASVVAGAAGAPGGAGGPGPGAGTGSSTVAVQAASSAPETSCRRRWLTPPRWRAGHEKLAPLTHRAASLSRSGRHLSGDGPGGGPPYTGGPDARSSRSP